MYNVIKKNLATFGGLGGGGGLLSGACHFRDLLEAIKF